MSKKINNKFDNIYAHNVITDLSIRSLVYCRTGGIHAKAARIHSATGWQWSDYVVRWRRKPEASDQLAKSKSYVVLICIRSVGCVALTALLSHSSACFAGEWFGEKVLCIGREEHIIHHWIILTKRIVALARLWYWTPNSPVINDWQTNAMISTESNQFCSPFLYELAKELGHIVLSITITDKNHCFLKILHFDAIYFHKSLHKKKLLVLQYFNHICL